MDATLANQITSLDEARAFITQLRNEFEQSLGALQTENKLLRQKLEFFIKRYFGGTRNEGLDRQQLELLLAGLEIVKAPTAAVAKPAATRPLDAARPVRGPLPAHLETERVVLEPEEVKQQPALWRKLGEEVTEELDWKPAKFIKRLTTSPPAAKSKAKK
jgi:hypothetical protein